MLSPSYLESLPVGIVNQYAELESWIIADISRRIAGADFVMTPTAEWQIKKAQMLRLSYDDVVKQVSRTLGKSQKEVRALFKEAGVTALKSDASIYSLAGKDPTAFMNSLALNRTLMAGIQQTNGLMSNFCRSLASESNKLYNDLLDQAYFEVQSGAFSYQTSIRKAVKQLGQQGIQTVKYPSGHTDQVDVAVRRALISGVNITCARLQLDLAGEMECDLVEVTSHFGARPSHADWQGGIYSISGKARGYRGLAEATGYGSGGGLCGWNCKHNFYPHFKGLSKPLGNPHDAKESEEYYNATQKQRAYERQIRKAKRQIQSTRSALEATTDKDLQDLLKKDLEGYRSKLRNKQDALDKFCKENDLYRRRERESIVKRGTNSNTPIKKPSTSTKPNKISKKQAKENYNNACKQVLERGKINGNENLLLTNLDGVPVFKRLDGNNNSVTFTPEFINFLENSSENTLNLIHNHPKSSSFSDSDMKVLSTYGSIKEITAYGHDGTLYKLSNNKKVISNADISIDYIDIRDSLHDKYCKEVMAGKLSPEEAWKQHSHEIIEIMAKKYGWTYTKGVL